MNILQTDRLSMPANANGWNTVQSRLCPHRAAFDYRLALHCAPVLAGIKPSNLISIRRDEWESVLDGLARSARVFGGKQIYFYKLASCDWHILLLVYRRDLLTECLALPENGPILAQYGYERGMSVGAMLGRLMSRMKQTCGFPHEIGVFLGYPATDVLGFIENNGRNYCLCGCWKVYGDPAEAKRLFSVYEHVRCYYCERVLCGDEIQNIEYGGIA